MASLYWSHQQTGRKTKTYRGRDLLGKPIEKGREVALYLFCPTSFLSCWAPAGATNPEQSECREPPRHTRTMKALNLILTCLNLTLLPPAGNRPKQGLAQSHLKLNCCKASSADGRDLQQFFRPERTSRPQSLTCLMKAAAENSCWEKAPLSNLEWGQEKSKISVSSPWLRRMRLFTIWQTSFSFFPLNKISQLSLPLKFTLLDSMSPRQPSL